VEQSRLLIAFVISLVIVVAYQKLVLSRYERTRPTAAPPTPAAPEPTTRPPAEANPPMGELAAPVGEERPVEIETDVYRVAITPVGARLTDIELKAYRRTVSADSAPLDLVQPGPVLPGTLALGATGSDAALRYHPDRAELVLHGSEQGDVTLAADGPEGTRLQKRYRFTGDGYVFEVGATVSGAAAPPNIGLVLTPVPVDSPRAREAALAFPGHLVEKPVTDLLKAPTRIDSSSWAGFAAQYFLSVALPATGMTTAQMTATDGTPIVRLDAPLADGQATFDVYAGPKDREILRRAGHDLDRALDFGWFWFIAVPLLQALRLLYGVFGNYGVAIIVLTALVKLATTPLTQTTFRNMREMQKIQPQMAKLRERFKDDQVALQKEMMELYRRHRVNPFSGCLPMVLQLPIFVGLYNALSHAIELRHAPFALWINDLSAPDRLMVAGVGVPVLTLFMGASMFVQQWLTPQQGDPSQQRMMMFMPLVFTFMFINFPAGLVLYWLVNNVLTIGQQYLMMRSTK
jgi:YidC/Oxa1 family membrane protein insertase